MHAFLWHMYGIRIAVRAHEDLLFEVLEEAQRERIIELITSVMNENPRTMQKEKIKRASQEAKSALQTPSGQLAMQGGTHSLVLSPNMINYFPRAINVGWRRQLKIQPMHIHCLTIGSRGDVQPYIALCKQLQKDGHHCTIVSHDEYRDWVREHDIDFKPVGGDPGALMKLSVDNNFFSPQFYREAMTKFRHWLDELLRGIMETCWDADLIIESPSTFGGIHVAEAVGCYYMRAFTMPWTRTSAYPQAFSVPSKDLGPQYNAMTYSVFDQILWLASSGQINRWRKNMLHLDPIDLAKLDQGSVPFMYNFSPAVVPPPLDWGDLIMVTGYWVIQKDSSKWTPPHSLTEFMRKARDDGKKLCYIGFGSITLSDPWQVQKAILEAIEKSDVRAIVSRGWSSRMATSEETQDIRVPESAYVVDSIPHDWLFPRIDLAMHHGGAGTTGASLQAGLVTLIHPFFGDQFFWSGRVAKLGAGLRVKGLHVDELAEALSKAQDDRIMREKAQQVGEAIRHERGVEVAVQFIYHNLNRAKRSRHPLKQPLQPLEDDGHENDNSRDHLPRVQTPEAIGADDELLKSISRDHEESGASVDAPLDVPLHTENNTPSRYSLSKLWRIDTLFSAATAPVGKVCRSRTQKSQRSIDEHIVQRSQSMPTKPRKQAVGGPRRKNKSGATSTEILPTSSSATLNRETKSDATEEEGHSTASETQSSHHDHSPSPPEKSTSWYAQHVHLSLPSIPQMSMPHLHFLNLRLLSLHRPEQGDTTNALNSSEKEKEKEVVQEEEKQNNSTARQEDRRRRRLLEEKWRLHGRLDLVHDRPQEIEENNTPVK